MTPKPFSLYGNRLKPSDDRKADKWQEMFVRKFAYDPNEEYMLSLATQQTIRYLRRSVQMR